MGGEFFDGDADEIGADAIEAFTGHANVAHGADDAHGVPAVGDREGDAESVTFADGLVEIQPDSTGGNVVNSRGEFRGGVVAVQLRYQGGSAAGKARLHPLVGGGFGFGVSDTGDTNDMFGGKAHGNLPVTAR